MVQAGSFSLLQNASNLRDRLRDRGFSVRVERTEVNGSTVYRVRVGPHNSRTESEQVRNRLERDLGIEATLVLLRN